MAEEYRYGSTVSVSSQNAQALIRELSLAMHPEIADLAEEVLQKALESQFEENPGPKLKSELQKLFDAEINRRISSSQ